VSTVEDNQSSFDLRLLWLLVIPGILIGAILTRVFLAHPDQAPSAATRTVSVSAPQHLGRCAIPTAQMLSQQSSAVQATVTGIDDTTAILRVTRVLAGPQVGTISVELPPAGGAPDTGMPHFVTGQSYLLAVAADGSLAGCGMSGPATGDLETLYTSAFG
jgi:hypothetical protein